MTHIVYGIDNKFLPPFLVSAYSMLKTVSGAIRITILTTDSIIEDSPDLRRLSDYFPNAEIRVQKFNNVELNEYEQKRTTSWSSAGMMTFFIPWLIPDKCIYLDADTVVLHDISELYRTDMGTKPLGACQAPSVVFTVRKYMSFGPHWIITPGRVKRRRREIFERKDRIGFTIEELETKYFNAGVLIYNTEEIRRIDPEKKLTNIKETRKHWKFSADQDRMNEFFKDRVCYLDLKWNVYRDYINFNKIYSPPDLWSDVMTASANPYLLHYTKIFGRKPWDRSLLKTRKRYVIYNKICREIEEKTNIYIYKLFSDRMK